MKQSFQRFGKCVRFDFTYNLIKKKSTNGNRWKLGIFSGFRDNLTPVIFGFAFTLTEEYESVRNIISSFINLQDGKYPDTWITDEQLSI